jgi:pimeloyl-ACP methyl ester carboxylesterase
VHPPGGFDRAAARVAHFPKITCPCLFLSGESDPFARLDLLRAAVAQLPNAELVTYPRLGHGLKPVLEDVLDRVARFVATLG